MFSEVWVAGPGQAMTMTLYLRDLCFVVSLTRWQRTKTGQSWIALVFDLALAWQTL